jgi:hypothetical protein
MNNELNGTKHHLNNMIGLIITKKQKKFYHQMHQLHKVMLYGSIALWMQITLKTG